MSTDYKLQKEITLKELFDGRLEPHGIQEFEVEGKSSDQFGVLTDGTNRLAVYADDVVKIIKRCGTNNENRILNAIADEFETDIYSEYSGKFWGYETDEEWEAAEFRKEEYSLKKYYGRMMAILGLWKDSPRKAKITIEDAAIANDLITQTPRLASPDCMHELMEEIANQRSSNFARPIFQDDCQIRDILKGYPDKDSKSVELLTWLEKVQRDFGVEPTTAIDPKIREQGLEQWTKNFIRDYVERTGCDSSIAGVAVQSTLDNLTLPDQYTLNFKHHGWVTVTEVLLDAVKYDRHILVDPLEAGNEHNATFMWNNGYPLVISKSHGGRVYRFFNNQINKSILLHGINIAHTQEGQQFAPRALRAACDLLFGEHTGLH
jgi:hypothetical protein